MIIIKKITCHVESLDSSKNAHQRTASFDALSVLPEIRNQYVILFVIIIIIIIIIIMGWS